MHIDARPTIRLPLGVRDFLPRAAARRKAIGEQLTTAFEAWGYARIITPMFECADVLERGLGADTRATAIRFVEPGTGDVVALRPDFTPQVARIAATRMGDIDGPMRLCYRGEVTRMGERQHVQREILQAGIELIGAPSPEGDAEAIAVAASALLRVALPHTRLDLGHVAPARYALACIDDEHLRRDIARLLSKKDRLGVARAAASLPDEIRAVCTALPTLWGQPARVLARARKLPWPQRVRQSLTTVSRVLSLVRDVVPAGVGDTITLDLGEVRGFEYYTGIRFAGYADGVGEAILVGGRYDDLVGRYGQAATATGFAFNIEAIAQAQRASGTATPVRSDALLLSTSRKRRRDAHRLAHALRGCNMRTAVDLGRRRSRAALLAYARETGFAWILVVGTREHAMLDVERADDSDAAVAISDDAIVAALDGRPESLARTLRRTSRTRPKRTSRDSQ